VQARGGGPAVVPAKARDRDAAGISHAATVSTVSPGAGGSASPRTVSFPGRHHGGTPPTTCVFSATAPLTRTG